MCRRLGKGTAAAETRGGAVQPPRAAPNLRLNGEIQDHGLSVDMASQAIVGDSNQRSGAGPLLSTQNTSPSRIGRSLCTAVNDTTHTS
jgi:hypothetical protein